ncbi:MAG: polysaccharide deacetylase family protein [Bacteroidales bacterium]|nr:polysaccharide deacetylase family protein [Bacteroidales bacterium]
MGKYYQKVLLRQFTPLIKSSGVYKIFKSRYSGRGQILMLHRVIPPVTRERIHNHLSIEITPEHLVNTILYFKNKDYDFINLDEISAWMDGNKQNKRRFVVFTFDDGYKDGLTHAYPIFKRYGIPFTIYITTSFPDNQAILWWYLLEEILLNNSIIKYDFPRDRVNLKCYSRIRKEYAFNLLRKIFINLNEEEIVSHLTNFFLTYGVDPKLYIQEVSLDWNEIRQLSADKLVCIGAHTVNHYNLLTLSDIKSRYEISESKKILEKHIKKPVNHFSYPLGQYGMREIQYVSESSFLTATTIKIANIFDVHLAYPFALPRITLNSLTTTDVLDLHLNGFFHFMLNGPSFRPNFL